MQDLKLIAIINGSKREMEASEAISFIDMADCHEMPYEFYVYDERLTVHGPWHTPHDPLYIKLTDSQGNIVCDGYGTDH